MEWVNRNDQCLWSRISCKDSNPVVITHDGDTMGRLNGTLGTEIGLLTHLGTCTEVQCFRLDELSDATKV